MKLLIGAAAAALLFAGAAMAQTATPTAPLPPSSCGPVPTAPTLPDGANATSAQMDSGNSAYNTWAQAMQANVQCRRAEAEAIRAQADARTAEYNGYAQQLNQTVSSWQAEVAEYNARGQQPNRRERGGTLTRPDH